MVEIEYLVNIRCDILLDKNSNSLYFEWFHKSCVLVDQVKWVKGVT